MTNNNIGGGRGLKLQRDGEVGDYHSVMCNRETARYYVILPEGV